MITHIRKLTLLSLVICFSLIHTEPLKQKLLTQAQNNAHEWVEQHITSMNDDQKQLLYNMLSLSCQLCIAPVPEILKPLVACTKHIATHHESDEELQHCIEYLQQRIDILSTLYFAYLEKKAKSVRKTHKNINKEKLEQAKLEQVHDFIVSITLAFYSEIYTYLNKSSIDKSYLLCMFDEFGLIPEDRRKHTMPNPTFIEKTFCLLMKK